MYQLFTDHPIAHDSPDHLSAKHSGSGNDSSRHPGFNLKMYQLWPSKTIRMLDLGCAGAGLVRSFVDDGHDAVGLEGSDYCKNIGKFEWPNIPDRLFTCDITRPFTLKKDGKVAQFDLVTAWEVMEHLLESSLDQMVTNVLAHLAPCGIWVMSVSEQVDGYFHRTIHDKEWWTRLFARHGLRHDTHLHDHVHPDWVRGPDPNPWSIPAGQSFYLTLRRYDE